ncbi:uncharacterized protein LOC127751991 [Frankliniella occidentalis]|uniref:Uncharacterized protein LOC127751991 n=1 Tax=Frankliniella occidentalis TaxID=133901 RepID=A0A9C6XAP9_FRAOC|nr:uncharacterized protein LOC127751991 [Frankliniella occidentalis]
MSSDCSATESRVTETLTLQWEVYAWRVLFRHPNPHIAYCHAYAEGKECLSQMIFNPAAVLVSTVRITGRMGDDECERTVPNCHVCNERIWQGIVDNGPPVALNQRVSGIRRWTFESALVVTPDPECNLVHYCMEKPCLRQALSDNGRILFFEMFTGGSSFFEFEEVQYTATSVIPMECRACQRTLTIEYTVEESE